MGRMGNRVITRRDGGYKLGSENHNDGKAKLIMVFSSSSNGFSTLALNKPVVFAAAKLVEREKGNGGFRGVMIVWGREGK